MTTPSVDSAKAAAQEAIEKRSAELLAKLHQLRAAGDNEALMQLALKLVVENQTLQLQMAKGVLRRAKGEGVSSDQLKLALDMLESAEDESEQVDESVQNADAALHEVAEAAINARTDKTDKKKNRKPKRQAVPAQLRRIDNPIAVAQDDRACPDCGTERQCIGHDVTEVLEYIPAEVVVRVDRREKLACKQCEGQLVRAPQGDKVVAGGKFGPTLIAHLIVDKYRDGLPLHRIKERLARLGLPVAVSTLADQVTWATDLLKPLWRAATVQVLGSAVMQLDGTGIEVRDKNRRPQKKLGSLWGYIGDDTAAYLYASTGQKRGVRPGELGPEDMLSQRSGYTVADASNLFDASFMRDDLIECGCNMHARRYFKKAFDAGDSRVAVVLGTFKALYDIEQRISDKPPDEKLAIRQKESEPIYHKLVQWCRAHQGYEPPKSPTGAAIRYLLNHQLALQRFCEHGAIPMDNGAVERLHIRVALTRKNYLFAGSDTGADRAAIAYTILACCNLAGVDPTEYLANVLTRLARRIRLRDAADLLPLVWKQRRN